MDDEVRLRLCGRVCAWNTMGCKVRHVGQLHRQTSGWISSKSDCRHEGFVRSPGKSARKGRTLWLRLASLGWLPPSTRRRLLSALVKTAGRWPNETEALSEH